MATGTETSITAYFMTTPYTAAPTGDDPLTPDDAVNVLEEILEAQSQSYVLGLKLKLPLHVVEDICDNHSQPRDRLLQILTAFLQQVDMGCRLCHIGVGDGGRGPWPLSP